MNSNHPTSSALSYQPSFQIDMQFPPLPGTVAGVSQILAEGSESPDLHELAEVVSADPVIAAAILRRVNSAHYGLRTTVGNVHQAVGLLGFLRVCNIALTTGMLQLERAFASDEQAYLFHEVMRASVGAAFFGEHLAQEINPSLKGKAYTAGLLHAVGRLVFLYNRPDDFEALWFVTEDHFGPRISEEKKIFGVNHATLGAWAAKVWGLPDYISQVLHACQHPEEAEDNRTLVLILAVAVSAIEQLCLDLRVSDGVVEEGGHPFSAPSALMLLARQENINPMALVRQIIEGQEKALDYIEIMLGA